MNPATYYLPLTIVACTPMAAGPPPTQIPVDFHQELGSTFGTGVQIKDQKVDQIFLEESLWYRKRIDDKSEVQIMGGAAWNDAPLLYGVIGFRRYFVTADGGEFGIDIKFSGPFYVEIGLPLQTQLGDNPVWLTTHPSIGLNAFGAVHIPLGITWQPNDRWLFITSLGTRFIGENPQLVYWNGGISIPFK